MVTVITKTIGSGKDFPDFTTAEAAVVTIVGGTDLVAADTAVVFEADAGTYNESVNFDGGLTTDATRNVTYKAAAGSEHGGVFESGVDLTGMITGTDNHTAFDTIQFSTTATVANLIEGKSVSFRKCLALINASHFSFCFVRNGTTTEPVSFEDCVFKFVSGTNGVAPTLATGGYDAASRFINCSVIGTHSGSVGAFRSIADGSNTATTEIVNCIVLTGGSSYNAENPGTHVVTGSNNFGGSTKPFPVALQGSPYPITASTAYDPGAGDFALYVGKNGALLDSPNNDVIGGGVGPSVNSDVPTTDILGNERSGALANPGAFEVPQAPTVITRTIGPDGDFTSFTNAEANVATIGTSADLVFNNERIVFEAEAGTYTEAVTFLSTLTTDATRQVTYKPAAGSEHGGDKTAGVILTSAAVTAQFEDDYTHLRGIVVLSSSFYALTLKGDGAGAFDCIAETTLTGSNAYPFYLNNGGTASAPIRVENCVSKSAEGSAYYVYASADTHAVFTNCTGILTGGSLPVFRFLAFGANSYVTVTNCLALNVGGGGTLQQVSTTLSGSNNFGGSTSPFPVALQGSPYPITASTSYDPGAGDYALYVASNGALLDSPNNDVIGQGLSFLDGAGDVPGYDIIGNPRGAKISNPGAFEIPQGPTVVTKTIGSDKDYPDFTAAEAAVASIATLEFGSTDLVANNGAIVFEADAGLYTGGTQINSTLVTDPTRNVTYTVAAGSEHGGDPASGVIIETSSGGSDSGIWVYDSHTIFDGLVLKTTVGSDSKGWRFQDVNSVSTVIRNCIFVGSSSGATASASVYALYHGYSAIPTVVENCRFSGQVYVQTTSADGNWRFINNTLIADPAQPSIEFRGIAANIASGTTLTVNVTNNWGNCTRSFYTAGAGTAIVTGSNNYGEGTGTYDFPAAIRGTPYPITATTDTDPGPGDWAIYDAATGALIDDPDNDVLGGGVGPDADADVPTTDIVGNIRSGDTTDPGAFQRPALNTTMTQIYQQDAPFAIGASPSGVSGITHQPGPAALDYFTINSTTSETITVPRTAHAMRIACVFATKACDVTLELDASNSVYLGTIGGIASVQADIDYFWSFASVASDGAYPRVKIEHDGVFSGDQQVYLWWHLA